MQRNNKNKTILLAVFLTFFISAFSFAQQKTPEISGRWYTNFGPKCQISQQGNDFQWRIESSNESGSGLI